MHEKTTQSRPSPLRILFKIPAPSPSTACATSFSLTQHPTLFSSPDPTPYPNFLALLLCVLSATNEPFFPSTALIRESVSKLPTTSLNSVLVRGWRMESRLHSMQYT